ncbi:hypothetical protein [Aestuariivirga sp.]|uniref:hypothetical protein n=1 Tax=Aestuariivirga sp. TaxID=2650926 RepID=UPI0035936268
MTLLDQYHAHGWLSFSFDGKIAEWAASALPAAKASARDPQQAHWLRCGGTWFVGVDALPNDAMGRVDGGLALEGAAMSFIRDGLGHSLPLHRAQVSVCHEGYPRPSDDETPAAYQYRVKRDAAHVDGLLAEGPDKRRYLKEPHAYILGLPLNDAGSDAAPLVAWKGSHHIMRKTFEAAFAGTSPRLWKDVDVTDIYQAARKEVFASCERVVLFARPGEATLLHRHVLHGVAPWGDARDASGDGRMIAYFRPEFENAEDWLRAP